MKKFDDFLKNKLLNNSNSNNKKQLHIISKVKTLKDSNSNNNSSNNITISKNEEIDKVFFKVFRNKYLYKLIMKYSNALQRESGFLTIGFNNLNDYQSSNRYFLKSVIIEDISSIMKNGINTYQFLNSFKKISPYLESLEIDNGIINVQDFSIPSTLKRLKLGPKIIIRSLENNLSTSIIEIFLDKLSKDNNNNNNNNNNSNNSLIKLQFYNLESLVLGYGSSLILNNGYLNEAKKLLHLTLNHNISKIITNEVLPQQLESLIINSEYPFESIYLPNNLKKFEINHGSCTFNPSIFECIPSNIEEISFFCIFNKPLDCSNIKSEKFSKSLKKLSVIYGQPTDQKKSDIEYIDQEFFLNSASFSSLVSLDLLSDDSQKYLNVEFLPSCLEELRISKDFNLYSTKTGYPKSLTSLDCNSKHLECKFSNPSNLRKLTIQNLHNHNQDFISKIENNFTNLESLIYNQVLFQLHQNCSKALPSSCLDLQVRLQSTSTINAIEFSDIVLLITLLPNSNLKSIRLNNKYTSQSLIKIKSRNINYYESLFRGLCNSKLLLLDLSFDYDILSNSIEFSKDNLPHSLKYLVIRGEGKVRFSSNLPESLEYIYISTRNETLKDQFEICKVQTQLVLFDDDYSVFNTQFNSKLYNKLKNKI